MPQQFPSTYLFGATSMAGWAIAQQAPHAVKFCNSFTRATRAATFERLNLDDTRALSQLLENQSPDLLIHCGGICDVDRC